LSKPGFTSGVRFHRYVLPRLTAAPTKCERTLNNLWSDLERHGDVMISRESGDRRIRQTEPHLESALTSIDSALLGGLGSDGSIFDGELEIDLLYS
jgi:hypothetical protein